MRSTVLTAEDRAIFDRLPVQVEAQYRHADALAARLTRHQLQDGGSIVSSVAREEAGLQLRAQRQTFSSARNLTELVEAGAL